MMMNPGSPKSHRIGIGIIRTIAGLVFTVHGLYLASAGLALARRDLATLGFPDSLFSTVGVILTLLLGGIFLLAGLATRWAATLLAVLGAIQVFLAIRGLTPFFVTLRDVPQNGAFLPPTLFEYWLTLLIVSLGLAVAGPGSFALDSVVRKKARQFPRTQFWIIAVMRVLLGLIFLLHGGQKIFVYGFPDVAAELAKLQIPFPLLSAVAITLAECLAGLALIGGLFTRWAAVVLATEMIVAFVLVHAKEGFLLGFFWPGGYEYTLTLLVMNVAIATAGAGSLALDNSILQHRAK